jgi:hypothetical protein
MALIRTGLADVLKGLGDLESKPGHNDQARAAYGDTLALYNQEDNRRGRADVLSGLGFLVSPKNSQTSRTQPGRPILGSSTRRAVAACRGTIARPHASGDAEAQTALTRLAR